MQDYDKSNRSTILAEAIRPFLRMGDSVLDIGCGYAAHPKFQGTILPRLLGGVSYHGIDHREDVIAECRNMYPGDEWTVIDAALFVAGKNYDAVFHLGFDRKDLSNAWKVHHTLLESFPPRIVLLEAGSPVGALSKHLESFAEVQGIYIVHGYELKAKGRYTWTYKVTQPDRRYAILERGK